MPIAISYQCRKMTVLSRVVLLLIVSAQAMVAQSNLSGISTIPIPATPAERQYGQELYAGAMLNPIDQYGNLIAQDSVELAIQKLTQKWVAELQTRPIKGLQLDPMGQLSIAAGQDAIAVEQFDKRLATPGLSVHDQAYTLLLAITTFSKLDDTTRIAPALEYLRRLDTLPVDAVTYQYRAHVELGWMHYAAMDDKEAIVYFTHALSLVSKMPFIRRMRVYMDPSFIPLADALIGEPNGRSQIDSIGKVLVALAKPDSIMVAADSGYYWLGQQLSGYATFMVKLTSHLGKVAPPIVGTHWHNADIPGAESIDPGVPNARTLHLGSGNVRLLAICGWSIAGCPQSVAILNRLKQSPLSSSADIWFVTKTSGSWGATPRTPEQEAEHLRHRFLNRMDMKIRIALWAGPKERRPWGGMTPRDNPSATVYPAGNPTFVLVDQNGIIRHILYEFRPRRTESAVRRRFEALIQPSSR